MKIKKLVVSNYKVFDYLELDFTDTKGQILDTIVLAGLNGSGKTTILDLLKDLIDGNVPNQLKANTEIKLEILFEKKYCREIDKSITQLEELLPINPYSENYNIAVFDLKKGEKINERLIEPCFEVLGNTIHYIFAPLGALYFYAPDKPSREGNFPNILDFTFTTHNHHIRQSILTIIQSEVFANPDHAPRQVFKKQVADLNKIFQNLDIPSKLIEVSEKDLIFESANGQKVGFDDLSSGEKMLYFMGFTLNQFNPQETIIMVDQPEDSLHPKWQQQITQFFKNIGQNNQIILATHSPQIIASVHPESLFVFAINEETHRVEAINMADEHKYSYGVDPNRILSEIMGTPLRDYQTQQKINNLNARIKQIEIDPSVLSLSEVEKQIDLLAEDLGKQDAAIMRFKNELRLLKRKAEVVK